MSLSKPGGKNIEPRDKVAQRGYSSDAFLGLMFKISLARLHNVHAATLRLCQGLLLLVIQVYIIETRGIRHRAGVHAPSSSSRTFCEQGFLEARW